MVRGALKPKHPTHMQSADASSTSDDNKLRFVAALTARVNDKLRGSTMLDLLLQQQVKNIKMSASCSALSPPLAAPTF